MANFNNAILFTSGDFEIILKIKEICKNLNLNLIVEKDLCSVIHKIVKIKPNFVFVDGEINDINTFPFKLLNNSIFEEETKLLVIGGNIADGKFVDNVSINNLSNYILNSKFYYLTTNKSDIDKNFINNFLLKAGFSPSHKGKEYLKECINLVLEDDIAYNCLNKDCYPIIAYNFRTGVINIDRDIRTAIKKAYENRDVDYWNQCFNVNFEKIPTSRSFIYLCVDKIKECYYNK